MGHAIIIFLVGLFCRFAISDEEKQKLMDEEAQKCYEEGSLKWKKQDR